MRADADGQNAITLTDYTHADLDLDRGPSAQSTRPTSPRSPTFPRVTHQDLGVWLMATDGSHQRQVTFQANHIGGIDRFDCDARRHTLLLASFRTGTEQDLDLRSKHASLGATHDRLHRRV